MTTEIAVLNRLGIALATDSAVTISSAGRTKVFDTADKLFELSAIHPVAVMINGNMDCLGVPWEVLVKDFRDSIAGDARDSVTTWMDDFLAFVERHPELSEADTRQYIDAMINFEILVVQNAVSDMISELFYQARDKKRPPKVDINKLLLGAIAERRAEYASIPMADSLKDVTVGAVLEHYGDVFDGYITERFPPAENITAEQRTALRLLMADALLSSQTSDFTTGVVVAGYGRRDTFPAIRAVEVEGRVLGRLKVTCRESETIADAADHGRVIYFAQTDVIERLLRGADPLFVEKTAEFIKKAVTEVAEAVEAALRPRRRGKAEAQKPGRALKALVETVADEYRKEAAETLRTGFAREFDRMIAMMPKQEVIELAEALVSITAVERKASSDEGTVGGPIDVAFISKHDGFVWIKRKHYFEKDLNPRYFWRKYGANHPGERP